MKPPCSAHPIRAIVLTLLATFISSSIARAIILPVIELTPENLDEYSFSIRIIPSIEKNIYRIVVAFDEVPPFLEDRLEMEIDIMDDDGLVSSATLKPMDHAIRKGYSFEISSRFLSRTRLRISEGSHTSFDHHFWIELSKFIKTEQTGAANPRPFGSSVTEAAYAPSAPKASGGI